jgi:hypothetical protein
MLRPRSTLLLMLMQYLAPFARKSERLESAVRGLSERQIKLVPALLYKTFEEGISTLKKS